MSMGLVAVTQRERFTNPVVLGPQKCYFLAGHLSPESPCKGHHQTCKQAVPTAEHYLCPLASSQPRTCKCCSNAALEMFSPELYWFYFSYPRLQMQASPDKLQCRKQIQAVIPENTGPVKTFLTLLRPCHALQNHPQGLMLRLSQGQQSVTPQELPALSLAQKS